MTRFKFSRKKKGSDADASLASAEQTDDAPHSYLRRSSISSKTRDFAAIDDENGSYTVSDDPEPEKVGQGLARNDAYDSPRPGRQNLSQNAPTSVQNSAQISQNQAQNSTPWKRHKLFNSPFPRYRHAASAVASDKNEIFLMGGLKEGSVFGDTWKLVPHISASGTDIHTFEALHIEIANDNIPPARVGHASVLCGNAYIVYGGDTVDTDASGFPDDNFYMFNINNRKYTVPSHIGDKPSGRYGHSLAVVSPTSASTRLYLFGGQLENDVYDDLYYFELTSFKSANARWERVSPHQGFKPPPLTNHSMCVYKTRLYVFGGVYNNEKVSSDVWCFDTVSDKWSQIHASGDKPLAVNEHSACIVGDNLFVYGGNDFCGVIYDALYCLNLHSHKWTRLHTDFAQNGPGPRCGHSMTYLPKLNKLLVMGGDKNDYVYTQASNFDTFEDSDDPDAGTMLFVLDVDVALSLMNGAAPKKLAASASGGAAGVLNRRNASPSPSEDALTRHRRSFSAGLDEYQTPNASVEKFSHSLDPQRNLAKEATLGDNSESNLEANVDRETAPEKFVDVDVSSVATSTNATQELNEIRETYLQSQDLESSEFQRDFSGNGENDVLAETRKTGSQTPDFTRNFEETNDRDIIEEAPLFASKKADVDSISDLHASISHSEIGTGALAQAHGGANLSPSKPLKSESHDFAARGGVWSPTRFQSVRAKKEEAKEPSSYGNASSLDNSTSGNGSSLGNTASLGNTSRNVSASDSKEIAALKQALAEAQANLSDFKKSSESEIAEARAQAEQLQKKHADLETSKNSDLSRQLETHSEVLAEKDAIIKELISAVDPAALQVSEEPGSEVSEPRGFTELTKYKLTRLDLLNKLAYVETENTQLKEKHAHFEPFMNNQVADLAALQKVVHGQEQRISDLVAQVKSESFLHKEIAAWKHKYEDLELEFSTYRSLNAEVFVSDDDNEIDENGATAKKSVSSLSSNLSNLVGLWQSNPVNATSRSVLPQDSDLVKQLQSQIDDLSKTSQAQHQGSSAEVEALEIELQAKLASLKTFEENYRDALQSVKNTSKALDLTQGEMSSQKLLIEKLLKENNELKLFKKAASASKKHSFQIAEGNSNGSSPTQVAHVIDNDDDNEEEEFTAAHYNMRLKDLEADLYIMKQERDSLTDQVSALKKELYLVRS